MAAWNPVVITLALGSIIVFSGCNKTEPVSAAPPEARPLSNAVAPVQPALTQSADLKRDLSAAEKSLKGGLYDEAAAQLLKMRIKGAQFSQQEAAAYRDALSDAYSRALEAAGKGDAKAQAAVKMIRAAGPH